jgi:hypothetical protein
MAGMSREKGIQTVYGGGGHVVLLGAGASIASTIRNPERQKKKLPSMDNFIDLVGLREIVERLPSELRSSNFETLYSKLHNNDPNSKEIQEIEWIVHDYFRNMHLPDEPTIYDYLVLSLRPKDIIATFNWDPFLVQAYQRNFKVADLPNIVHLHGNVAIGYNNTLKRPGPPGYTHRETMTDFEPTRLLFPVTQKNYNQDEFTKREWETVRESLGSDITNRITIFGYGAPATDVEAVKLLNDAWGTPDERNMEQVEIIDVRPQEEVREQWDSFIHSHHYDYADSFFDSVIARFPRRTSESWFHHYLPKSPDEMFMESNPVPQNLNSLEELWEWYQPLIEAEKEWKEKQPKEDK